MSLEDRRKELAFKANKRDYKTLNTVKHVAHGISVRIVDELTKIVNAGGREMAVAVTYSQYNVIVSWFCRKPDDIPPKDMQLIWELVIAELEDAKFSVRHVDEAKPIEALVFNGEFACLYPRHYATCDLRLVVGVGVRR